MGLLIPLLSWLIWLPITYGEHYIVVGGGTAGLTAARTIVDEGQGNHTVYVLEARRSRYGGRIRTSTQLGVPIDMGASWIHGTSDWNPIAVIAEEQGIETVVTNYSNHGGYNHTSGDQFIDEELRGGLADFGQMMVTVDGASPSYDFDTSVREIITLENLDDTYQDPLVQFYTTLFTEAGYGTAINNLSGRLFGQYIGTPGPHEVFPEGYIQILDYLVNGDTPSDPDTILDVRLGQQVTKVTVSNDMVTLTLADSTNHTADRVIVTVPLGILKDGDIEFEPALDTELQEAIQSVGFGLLNRLALRFDQVFWDANVTFFALAPEDEDDMGMLKDFWNMEPVVNEPVLTVFMSGDAAWESEGMTEQQLVDIAMGNLRLMFGDSVLDEVTLVSSERSNWLASQYAKGSYSFPAVGELPGQREELGQPRFDCRVLFAGEHTPVLSYGTVDAAYESGERAAREAMAACATVNV